LAFVAEYLTDFRPRRAAEAVGYTGRAVSVTASNLLSAPHIAAEIRRRLQERMDRLNITADRCLRDIDRAANLDVAELCDEAGNLLPLRAMPAHVRRCIVSVDVIKRNLTAGDGTVDTVLKVKLIDKGRMHEVLAKATGVIDGQAQAQPQPVPAFVFTDCPGISVH
jgi:phage terminase small subunit